jgi:DNA gyrase subunit B
VKSDALEVVMTVLHAGGKFDKDSYAVSGGLHGVGVSVVNALSEWLEAEVRREGKVFFQRYERGAAKANVKVTGEAKKTGTKITFKADKQIFSVLEFNHDTVANRLREISFLNKGLTVKFRDERGKEVKEHEFHFEGGISAFVKHLNKSKEPIHATPLTFEKQKDGVTVEIAMQWNESYTENIFCFVNNINTRDGGSHLVGFKSALTRAANKFAKDGGLASRSLGPVYAYLNGPPMKMHTSRSDVLAAMWIYANGVARIDNNSERGKRIMTCVLRYIDEHGLRLSPKEG